MPAYLDWRRQPITQNLCEETEMTGRVVHFEVPFSDGKRAKDFYQQAFGWQLNEMPEM